MKKKKKEYSAKQLRIIRFGGVLIFIGSILIAFILLEMIFLRRCLASGNSVKYCNDI